jgi:hypothetical protein
MALNMTENMFRFLQEWADAGAPVVRKHRLPVSAMLACASVESAWGTGAIYRETLNPFSLQKWPHVPHPATCRTAWRDTVIQTTPDVVTRKAPFSCATDRADAVRQWCEWILYYGEADGPPGNQDPKSKTSRIASAVGNRETLLRFRNAGPDFARRLPLVGFGESRTSLVYAKRLTDFSMESYD